MTELETKDKEIASLTEYLASSERQISRQREQIQRLSDMVRALGGDPTIPPEKAVTK